MPAANAESAKGSVKSSWFKVVVKWTGCTGTERINVVVTQETGHIRTGLCGDEAETA